ncbi:MAG: VOC family protein, partial [Solirubrobacterales bacterium]|nr:VOC family protein [Solirubrobacterales bacterium]
MDQRVSAITLGVGDLERAKDFYARLGWAPGQEVEGEIAFFQAGGLVVALWDRGKLAADSGVEDGGGWGGITLAHNVRSPDEVDALIEAARATGARVTAEPSKTDWGGYHGAFVDPEGHAWEIAHN